MSHVSGLWQVLGERIIVASGASKTRTMVCSRAPEMSRFPDAQLRIEGLVRSLSPGRAWREPVGLMNCLESIGAMVSQSAMFGG